MLQISLIYLDESLGDAFRRKFRNAKNVTIVAGDITNFQSDAVVSPANSFGFMDGGLDDALSVRFGWDLQSELQKQIQLLPEKELLVGRSLTLETNDSQIPYLIAAPTMRVPMSFNIGTSVNAYLAMKAILIAATQHHAIRSVSIPGLCTGVGRMPTDIAATQMFAAFDEVVNQNYPAFADFGEAQQRQCELNPNSLIWDY